MIAGLTKLHDRERDSVLRGSYRAVIDRLSALRYRLKTKPENHVIGLPLKQTAPPPTSEPPQRTLPLGPASTRIMRQRMTVSYVPPSDERRNGQSRPNHLADINMPEGGHHGHFLHLHQHRRAGQLLHDCAREQRLRQDRRLLFDAPAGCTVSSTTRAASPPSMRQAPPLRE
jgi:hypothetical protein